MFCHPTPAICATGEARRHTLQECGHAVQLLIWHILPGYELGPLVCCRRLRRSQQSSALGLLQVLTAQELCVVGEIKVGDGVHALAGHRLPVVGLRGLQLRREQAEIPAKWRTGHISHASPLRDSAIPHASMYGHTGRMGNAFA